MGGANQKTALNFNEILTRTVDCVLRKSWFLLSNLGCPGQWCWILVFRLPLPSETLRSLSSSVGLVSVLSGLHVQPPLCRRVWGKESCRQGTQRGLRCRPWLPGAAEGTVPPPSQQGFPPGVYGVSMWRAAIPHRAARASVSSPEHPSLGTACSTL